MPRPFFNVLHTLLLKHTQVPLLLQRCTLLVFVLASLAAVRGEKKLPVDALPEPIEIWSTNQIPKGYYFISPLATSKTPGKLRKSYLMILNEQGKLLYYQPMRLASDFKIQHGKHLSYYNDGKFFVLDSTLKLVDSVWCMGDTKTDSHDFQILPNGNYLLIGKRWYREDLSHQALFLHRSVKGSKHALVGYDVIQEYNCTKELVYEWDARPHFNIDHVNTFYLTDTSKVDLTHFNSVDCDAQGNFLISSRFFDQIIYVNRQSKAIVWRLGGKNGSLKILGDSLPFFGQHDARFRRPNHISLFDNGYHVDSLRHTPRGLEYEIDEGLHTAKLSWSYVCPFDLVVSSAGSLQRLPDNNALLNYGKHLNLGAHLGFEIVDESGRVLSQAWYRDTLYSYRAFFYPQTALTIELPEIRTQKVQGGYRLSVSGSYPFYRWSTGSTQAHVLVTSRGRYRVDVSRDGQAYYRTEIKF